MEAQIRTRSIISSVIHWSLNATAAASLMLSSASALLWPLSFGPLAGNSHGSDLIYVWRGDLYIGPPFPNGEIPRHWEGWRTPVVSQSHFQSAAGATWTSTRVDLLLAAVVFAVLPAARYRIDKPFRRIARTRRARRGLCPTCGYDLRGTPPRGCCPECGTAKSAIAEELRPPDISQSVSGPAAAFSLAMCAALLGVWVLSFPFKGDQRGVQQVFVADGKLWVGPLFRGGEDAVVSDGWNLGLLSWTRSQGVWGGRWTSFHIELWPLIVLAAIPAAIRYRLLKRIQNRIMGTAGTGLKQKRGQKQKRGHH